MVKVIKIVAGAGTWYCETCKRSMSVLYKSDTGESYCDTCLPEIVDIIRIVNQNRDVIKDV